MRKIYNIEDKWTEAPKGLVGSVAKAMRVLNCFTTSHAELSLAQISSQLSIPKSTTLNLIKTLELDGYLQRIKNSQNYRLGFKLLELSYYLRSNLPVVQYALPLLEDLQIQTSEIIYLTSHINGRVLYLEGIYPSRRMGNYSICGKTLPMHCTGCGKAMLAFLPQEEIEYIIDYWGTPAITSHTISDREKLLEELALIRKRGYSIDLEEETLGVKCIAMAIRNSNGYPTGAISISGTTVSMKDDLLEGYAQLLSRVCNALIGNANQLPAGQLLDEDRFLNH